MTTTNKFLIGIIAILLVMQLLTVMELQRYKSISMPEANPSSSMVINAATSECTATVNVRLLNQRSGAGESYSIIGEAARGDVFTVIEQQGQWLRVNTDAGTAWMASRYMSRSDDCDALPVSSSPNEVAALSATSTPQAMTESTRREAVATPMPTATAPASNITTLAAEGLSPIFTAEVQYWANHIQAWATQYQLDPNVIATVIQLESCGNPTVSSSAGAQGLFQVMPFHFTADEEMLDIETNARRGLNYLVGALELSNGDVGLALAGYNGGYGVISSGRWAAETQRYYYWGSGIYAEASAGAAVSPTLQEWLAAGGSSLCASASRIQQTG